MGGGGNECFKKQEYGILLSSNGVSYQGKNPVLRLSGQNGAVLWDIVLYQTQVLWVCSYGQENLKENTTAGKEWEASNFFRPATHGSSFLHRSIQS